jgi:hypothetical protein
MRTLYTNLHSEVFSGVDYYSSNMIQLVGEILEGVKKWSQTQAGQKLIPGYYWNW